MGQTHREWVGAMMWRRETQEQDVQDVFQGGQTGRLILATTSMLSLKTTHDAEEEGW